MASPPAPARAAGPFGWMAVGLLALTVYGSLIPLRYHPVPLDEAVHKLRTAPLASLAEIGARADWLVNLAQYAALSFCFTGWLAVDRRPGAALLAAALVVPAGAALAVGLELLQVSFPPRTVSPNDVLFEALGVGLGAAAWLLGGQAVADRARRRRGLADLAAQALPAYVVVLVAAHAMPFDFVVSRAELALKVSEGRVNLVPFARLDEGLLPWLDLLKNAALFAVFGALLALGGSPRRRWPAAAGAGLALAAVVELLQLAAFTRYCDLTDVLTGPAGAALGFALARRWRLAPAPGERPHAALAAPACLALLLGWSALLLAVNWQPWHFSTDPAEFTRSSADLSDEDTAVSGLRRFSHAPFVDYYWGSRYQALDQIARRALSFAPLGALLALGLSRRPRAGWAAALALGAALAAAIEAGQYFIPRRHPSVTDWLIQTAGALAGYALARHVAGALAADRPAVAVRAPAGPALTPALFLRPAPAPRPPRRGRPRPGAADSPEWARAAVLGAVGATLVAAGLLLLHLAG
jgi:VanZ family protein